VSNRVQVAVVAAASLLGMLPIYAADVHAPKAYLPDHWRAEELDKYMGLQFGFDPGTRARLSTAAARP
jgi:hypothetical protein